MIGPGEVEVCHMNAAPPHATGNGPVVGSSTTICLKPYMANTRCYKIPFNDASIPCGGVQFLYIPIVVVLVPWLIVA